MPVKLRGLTSKGKTIKNRLSGLPRSFSLFYLNNMEAYDLILDIIREVDNMNQQEGKREKINNIDAFESLSKQSAYSSVLLYLNDKRQEVR
jgi:hypothetical protein